MWELLKRSLGLDGYGNMLSVIKYSEGDWFRSRKPLIRALF